MNIIKKLLSTSKHELPENTFDEDNFKYNEDGYYIHHEGAHKGDYKVTIVLPVYNAESTLRKTIDSVIRQTIGFNNIELIAVDDHSTDNSRNIILEYEKNHKNIIPVFLENNTGSPAIPRNIGIKLATGHYISFIDSDDYITEIGIEVLYNLLEETGNNYSIGKTVKVYDNKIKIAGEYNSCQTRPNIDPIDIPHVFQHLGPTARMMRTSFIKKNNITFPNMKYAEDKQFFIDVLTRCDSISTSKELLYYANRRKENESLIKETTIFEKTDANIRVIKYVIEKPIPDHVKKMILNRLYEFDCITRLFNKAHFLKAKNKEKYFDKFREVLKTTERLDYDFTENFFEPWHKILVRLFIEERYEDIITLINWSLNEPIKETTIYKDLPYYRLPLESPYHQARINMLACHKSSVREKERLLLNINVYGDQLDKINSFVIRERNNELNEIELPIKKLGEHEYEVIIPFNDIANLTDKSYTIFIRYNNYRKLFIKMNTRQIINYNHNKIDFYTTIGDNFGLQLKKSQ